MALPTIHNAEVFPPGFDVYRHNRQDGYGGAFIVVHKFLTSHEVSYSDTHDIVACRLKLSNNNACCIYRPPNCMISRSTCNSLERIIFSYLNDAIWLAGDFNILE